MVSPFSPPVLYLTDDDDDVIETEQNIPYDSLYTAVINDNLPHKKRKITNTNVRLNPSIVNWSKRQQNDHYQHQQTAHPSSHHEPERVVFTSDDYGLADQESHSFLAFDWTTESQTPARVYSNPIQTTPQLSMVPPPSSNVMNVVRHHLYHSDTVPLIPIHHQDNGYIQHPQRKSTNILASETLPPPPPALPLETVQKLKIIFAILLTDVKTNNVISG